MAGSLGSLIRADWHDGYEEQAAELGNVMFDVCFMLAAASAACGAQKHSAALKACAAIGKGG